MILPDFVLTSRQNQVWKESGMDSLKNCIDKQHFKSYPHQIEYRYNTRGFRDQEWPDDIDKLQNAIWCIGDSFTVGIGSPREHIWPYILQQQTGIRTINVSMDGASNNWIARRCIDVIKNINPKTIIAQWSYIERREQLNRALEVAWIQFYAAVRSPDWPNGISLENFYTLPEHIKEELLTSHDQQWRAGISDEQMRLPYVRSTDEEDIENTITCLEQVNQAAHTVKVVHSFVPQFVNQSCKKSFNDRLSAITNKLIIPEIIKIDTARDGHHYDVKTATKFVESVLALLN